MNDNVFIIKCQRMGRKAVYAVSFEYNVNVIDRIKELNGKDRKWNPDNSCWELTVKGLFLLINSYKGINEIFFDFGGEEDKKRFLQLVETERKKEEKIRKDKETLEENKKRWNEYKEELEKNFEKYSDELHSLLNPGIKLYPHQIIATMFINKIRSGLVSHEMGLGKTIISILFAELNKFNKVVVITPNSLKFNYYNEVKKFTNSKAHIVNWKKNEYSIEESRYIILNYEFFNSSDARYAKSKWDALNIKKIDALVADECQRLKNSKSNSYKNYKKIFNEKIFRNEPNKVFLSGTPSPNRVYELYNVLNQISPLEFKRKKDFYEHYCGMYYDFWSGWGYVTNTEDQKFEELYEKISPYTHRKRKFEVLTDLPEKTFQRVLLEMNNSEEKEYNNIEKSTADDIDELDPKPHHLSVLMDLRKYLSNIKRNKIVDIIYDIVNTGEKVVIIDFFKQSLRELKEEFGEISVIHTGDQTIEERQDAISKFQDVKSNVKIFLGSTDVTKEGLTLTASSKMFLLTLPFVPGVYDQITDRLHRIGQKNAVNIYIPIFENTIDLLTLQLIDDKKSELSVVMDNEKYVNTMKTDLMKNIFKHLIKKYENK
jgi:SNF2 family DNA or RNA helicase